MDDPFREGPWWRLLEEELGGAYLRELLAFVDTMGADVYPPRREVFRALELTPPRETKVVIVGQDPYHAGQAHAAYNLETIRSFLARMAVVAEVARKPRTRKKRRQKTWHDVVAIRPAPGPDPPPG